MSIQAPNPEYEAKRLEAVARYGILDTPDEESFDRITRLAASFFSTPIALISIVDKDRVWVKSGVGRFGRQIGWKDSFSVWAVLSREVFVVNDATTDPRFRDSSVLIQDYTYHFYAGAPLITPDGFAIGALSIVDQVPRPSFDSEATRHLVDLAALIVDQLELRRKTLLLQSSEADYRDLFEHCPIGIYRTSPAGEILMANPAIVNMLGYPSVETLKERNLETNELVDTRARWKAKLEAQGKIPDYESTWYALDGRAIQISETTRLVRRADGDTYYEGWAQDITARKSAEAERERAQTFSQKLIEAAPDLIYIFDLEKDRSVFANRSYFKVLGQDPDYVRKLDDPIAKLVHPEDLAPLRRHRQRLKTAADGEFMELEFRALAGDGNFRLLGCRETVFLRDENGEAKQLLGIIRDISERRAMEERLRRDEERWQLALAANNDGIWDWEARTGNVFHSHRWREILGFDEQDEEADEPWENLLHPEDAEEVLARLDSYLRRETPTYQQEYRLRAKNGTYRWVFARGVAQWDDEGKPLRMVGAHSDITERKEAELALRLQAVELAEARDKAESAAKAKSSFLATMSHELRTPLNGVIGMTGILSGTALSAEQQDYLRTIRSSGAALLTVINDILDFSKIEAGHMELEETDFDLSSIVEESLDLVAEKADRKGVELAAFVDRSVSTWVRGDGGRLRQILLNLLSNAVKFTHRGEVVLSVAKADPPASSSMLRFSVADTGIGMSEEVCTRIFSPFSQADASTTRRFGGTGLGLAISKQLVELMGGNIGVESKEGVGSTFWFHVDLQPALRAAKDPSSGQLEGTRILVADDNPTNLRIIRHLLEAIGVEVVCAQDGLEALSALIDSQKTGRRIDLALLDFQMPRMDGLMLTRAIRAQRGFEHFPIVLLTSVTQRDHIQEAKDLDIQGYLIKPLRNLQLVQTIRALLHSRQNNADSPSALPPVSAGAIFANRNSKVLLAEDNPVNQRVGILMLAKLGYQVDVVANGREAVEAFQRGPYDCILLDCQMPEMDGFEATKRIRQIEAGRSRIAIIALTANALAGERERCIDAGMDDYLSKPIDQQSLGLKLAAFMPQSADVDRG
jgi:PAS domain S-box-containing protein